MSDTITYHISIPTGYQIDQQLCSIDMVTAARLLRTKGRRRYTSALRENNNLCQFILSIGTDGSLSCEYPSKKYL